MFSVYLGNIPFDVTLTELKLNNRRLPVAVTPEYDLSKVVHSNGSQAYVLRVPFDSRVVHRMVSSPVHTSRFILRLMTLPETYG